MTNRQIISDHVSGSGIGVLRARRILSDTAGLSLVELLVVIAIMAIMAVGVSTFLSSVLHIHSEGNRTSGLYREGLMIMERMRQGMRRSTYLMIPNAHSPVRSLVAFSGNYNDDNDFFFGDPLFPRIDEDPWRDMNNDNANGLQGVDDDGDGNTDESGFGLYNNDEDEDNQANEDDLDGLDNDGDGNIDEDTWADLNMDWAAGVKTMDDDGDGTVDEGHENDDDEDGQQDEDPLNEVVYRYDAAAGTLTESTPHLGETAVLSNRVTLFRATFEAPQRILIEMTLADDGGTLEFYEHVHLQNVLQRTGKRVH
ncbi:MAG: prepilin-type N-terminal cleavage/methylation domain-containing protein [Desulfobacteraceae bacterium]|jgi:prepilin-type N-terminal cleavage/methylation domain-containing protein